MDSLEMTTDQKVLTAQRDELLLALRELLDVTSLTGEYGIEISTRRIAAKKQARSAIAKVEEASNG